MVATVVCGFSVTYLRTKFRVHTLSVLIIGLFGTGKTFLTTLPTYFLRWYPGGVIANTSVSNVRDSLSSAQNLVWSFQDPNTTSDVRRRGCGSLIKTIIEMSYDGARSLSMHRAHRKSILSHCVNVITMNHRSVPEPLSYDGGRTTRRTLEIPINKPRRQNKQKDTETRGAQKISVRFVA